MKILLTGRQGQVGFELQRSLASLGEVVATCRETLDLTDSQAIIDIVSKEKPDLIVNAAAYTAVDKAETDTELAMSINADAVAVLAKQAKLLDIPFIHYSTDYVFSGENTQAWLETDTVAPINFYGETKLRGEQAIRASGCNHLIFRTSWVYGTRGQNFLLTMRRLARERDSLSVITDQLGTPTWSRHIADVTAQIVAQSAQDSVFWVRNSGVYHLTGSGLCSWYDFAKVIFDDLAGQGETVATLNQTLTEHYPTPAKRPLFSVMNNDKLAQRFGLRLPDWHDSVALALAELKE